MPFNFYICKIKPKSSNEGTRFFIFNNCTKLSILCLAPAILILTQELTNHMLLKDTNNIHIDSVLHNILICIRTNIGTQRVSNYSWLIKHTSSTCFIRHNWKMELHYDEYQGKYFTMVLIEEEDIHVFFLINIIIIVSPRR